MVSEEYRPPAVTEYGSVESLTEQNKSSLGTDTDVHAVNLKGSAPNL